jgi:cyclopropane fatty-acyl-phospholipid synthase-like methyltransferase
MTASLNQVVYELMYRLGKPVWGTGGTPPEVVTAIGSGRNPGRALDLGCGTGTHSIYLSQHGWDVVGVDFSRTAIAGARDKARQAGVQIDWRVADVTRLESLTGPFDFALDVGCFHGLKGAGRASYVEQLSQLVRPGGLFMLWAFDRPAFLEDYGVEPQAVEQLLTPHFALDGARYT